MRLNLESYPFLSRQLTTEANYTSIQAWMILTFSLINNIIAFTLHWLKKKTSVNFQSDYVIAFLNRHFLLNRYGINTALT